MTSFSKIGFHKQYGPQIVMTIEIRGGICAFIYSASVSANEEACIVSITLFAECITLNSVICTK